MINTSECEDCMYGTVHEENKANIRVYCAVKDKTYFFGQCVPCDNKRKRVEGVDNE